jgi:hypothetical protein
LLAGGAAVLVANWGVGVNPAWTKSGMVALNARMLTIAIVIITNRSLFAFEDFFIATSLRIFYWVGDDDQAISGAAIWIASDECNALVVGGLDVARVRLLHLWRLSCLRQYDNLSSFIEKGDEIGEQDDLFSDLDVVQLAEGCVSWPVVSIDDGVAGHPQRGR